VKEKEMKKGLIFWVMLAGTAALGFSQTAWTVSNAASWVEAVNGIRNGGNSKVHTITVSGTVSVIPTPASENTFGSVTGVTVTIQSPGNDVISLNSNGSLLRIGSGQTVVVKDLTLKGRSDNNAQMVFVEDRGSFRMEGKAEVSGNNYGGVYINNGTFTMQDNATVSDNQVDSGVSLVGGTFTMKDNASVSRNTERSKNSGRMLGRGGGVYVSYGTFIMQGSATVSGNIGNWRAGGVHINAGTFTMQGNATVSDNDGSAASLGGGGVFLGGGTFTMQGSAKVSGNTSGRGGGVFMWNDENYQDGTFTMQDNASVSGNTSDEYGGGVWVSYGTLTIRGNATVSNNTSKYNNGGGICVEKSGTFIMQDNTTVSGNTAAKNGGGVFIFKEEGTFTKKGGTIYGSDETNAKLRNIAKQGSAIHNEKQWRNATAGPSMNTGTFGFWLNEEEVVQSNTASPSSGNVVSSPAGNVTSRPPDVTAFPIGFRGTWKKANTFNKITIDANSIKVSLMGTWLLTTGSGDSYKVRTEKGNQTITLTMKLVKGNLEISCNDNLAPPWNAWDWNGTLQK
jgi:predicted outer membrane repeat protein